MTKQLVLSVAVLSFAGCAAIPIPVDHLERAGASIRGAEEVGAMNVPDAKLHLQLAKEQMETAKKMADQGDDRAVLVLARAESDAELALGMAREASTRADADKATEDLKALQTRGAP